MNPAVVLIVMLLFFLPSIAAVLRGRNNPGSVIVVNLFLGVTGIGWVVALAMAFGGG